MCVYYDFSLGYCTMPLDNADIAILNTLRRDARITNQELAERVGLSASACSRRIQRLQQDGVISGYGATIDETALGRGLAVLIFITLSQQSEEFLEAFEHAVRDSPGMRDGTIAECYLLSGRYDYMMRVAMRDMADYETFHKEQLSRLPGVARVETSFAMRNIMS